MLKGSMRLLVASVGGVVLITAGCGFGTSSPTSQGNKTLVVDTSFTFDNADPVTGGGTTGFLTESQLYDTLVRPNPSSPNKLDPGVAQSYVASSDGLSVTFNLRHDVHFSDGTPLTSADAVFSLMRLKYMNGVNTTTMNGLTVTAPDTYTVVITAAKPDVFIASKMTFAPTGIINSKVVKANGGTDGPDAAKTDTATSFLSQTSAGSGPYVLVSVDPKVQIVMKANPNYWGSRKPVYTKVILRNEAATAQVLDVQQGQDTIAMDLSPQQAATVDTSKVKVISQPSLETLTLMLNANQAVSPATANLQLRQAVRYAIDYKALLALGGLGTVQATGMLPSGIPGSLPSNQVTARDPAKAKSLLAQSGVTNPTFALTYASDVSISGLSLGDLAQLIQANLKDAGITVTLVATPNAILRPKWFANQLQAHLFPLGGNTLDASGQVKFMANGQISKWMGWKTGMDPASDALASQILSNADPAKEASLIMQEQVTTNEFAVFIPIFLTPIELVASKSIGGLNLNPLGLSQFVALT